MYFSAFPNTQFNGKDVLDITRKANIDKLSRSNVLSYMNYRIEEEDRPEDVAFYYYDDPAYAWLVLAANDIVDPYTEWPKGSSALEEYIKAEYAEQAGTTGDGVIEWTKNTQIGTNIVHYQSHSDPDVRINRASYLNAGTQSRAEFYPVRVYDYEFNLNEDRRGIVLINKSLLPTIKDSLKSALNGS